MAKIQARLPCPRCPRRLPIMTMSGLISPAPSLRRRQATRTLLQQAGLDPDNYG